MRNAEVIFFRFLDAMMPSFLRKRINSSIYLKTLASSLIVIGLILACVFIALFVVNWQNAKKDLRNECRTITERVANNIAVPAWNYSTDQVDIIIMLEMQNRHVTAILFSDEKDGQEKIATGMVKDSEWNIVPVSGLDGAVHLPNIFYTETLPVQNQGVRFGEVSVSVTSFFTARQLVTNLVLRICSIVCIVVAGLFIIFFMFKKNILDPISSLNNTVLRFQNKDFNARAEINSDDEIGTLSSNFNDMAETLAEYSRSLERMVDERTMQLIQAEKMASLGELVASVAHDISTPVGLCVTSISYLSENVKNASLLFQNNELKRSDLEIHFNVIKESIEIMENSLSRISDLAGSFKKLSSDRYVEEKRIFNVKNYIDEIMVSLKPKIKRSSHSVGINCPENLIVETFPGSFSQVIMNFAINALVHGFEERKNGIIMIDVATENNDFILRFSDNGSGIAQEYIDKIYDPFFTTKRGKGGTGLGLNIVFRIVTQMMEGTIQCESIPDKGTTFIVKIPDIVCNGKMDY